MNKDSMNSINETVTKHSSNANTEDYGVRNRRLSCASEELTNAYEYAKNSYSENVSATKPVSDTIKQIGDNINASKNIATQIQQRIFSVQTEQPKTVAEQALNTVSGFISYFFLK